MKNALKIGLVFSLLALAPVQSHAQTVNEDSIKASRRGLIKENISKIKLLTMEELRNRKEKACDEPLFDSSRAYTGNDSLLALYGRGLMLNDIGRYNEAAGFLESALEKTSSENSILVSSIYTELGHAYSNMNDCHTSIESYHLAINFCPLNSAPYNGLALEYLKLKNFRNAEEYAKQALEYGEKELANYLALAEIQFAEGKYNDCITTLQKGVEKCEGTLVNPQILDRTFELKEKAEKEK